MTTHTEAPLPQLSAQDTGKAIRAALKAAFPGTKFSVRMSRGTAFGSFYVSWTDGPRTAAVDALVGRFAGTSFNGSDDSTHNTGARIEWQGRTYLSGAGYISACRTISDELHALGLEAARRWWPTICPHWVGTVARCLVEAECTGDDPDRDELEGIAMAFGLESPAQNPAPLA